MGSSFANVQVSTRGAAPAAVRDAIIESLRRSALPGQTILVAPATAEPWIALFDDADVRELAAAIGKPAAVITVHDGDLAEVALLHGDDLLATVTNWPGYFDGAAPPPRAEGDPTVWRDLIVAGDLEQAWRWSLELEPGVAFVRRMARVVGWNPELATAGFQSIPETFLPHCTEIRLDRSRNAGDDPPRLVSLSGAPPQRVRAGQPVHLFVGCRNAGGPSTSIAVTLSGTAVERGLVVVSTVKVTADGSGVVRLVRAGGALAGRTKFGVGRGGATLLEFSQQLGNPQAALRAWNAALVEVLGTADARAPGEGTLDIALQPDGAAEAAHWTIDLVVE